MVEKEAKERYKEHLADPNYYESSEEESYLHGFHDGAEFGYNKAKVEVEESYRESLSNSELNLASVTEQLEELEKANEWHDLRKDPKDLPNGYRDVLNQVGMATKYDPTRGFLGLDGIGVIAWREIPIFEKG